MGCPPSPDFLLPSRYHGVLVVIVTVIVYIPVGGQLQSFGVFVEKLNEDFCPFDCLQLLSWIGALSFGINRLFCWLIVSLQKRLSTCLLFFVGVILSSAAMTLSSFITDLSWLFITYCVVFGVGSSLVMNSPYALIESYFPSSHKYHILATSLMNVGSPVGSMLMNPLSAHLDRVAPDTWRDTMRIYGGIMLVVGLFCNIIMRKKTEIPEDERTPQQYEDLDGSTGHPFVGCSTALITDTCLWTMGIFLLSFAIYVPKVHFMQYMESINMDLGVAAMCMSYEGMAEAVLSFATAFSGDFVGRYLLFVYVLSCSVIAVCVGLLTLVRNQGLIAVYCAVHGATDGITMTLLFSATSLLAPSGTVKNYIWAATFFVNGLGQILGIPLAGYIYDRTKSYNIVFYMAAGVFSAAALTFLVLAVRVRRHQTEYPSTQPQELEMTPVDNTTKSAEDPDNQEKEKTKH
ncbi:monocarboxylate transporter 10-like [Haliotis rufescens]|uniref:monocarboxylate transporter 10-like n=1 Tax=Haliotis rufescens TaxID=6454 RepID=UPI00201E8BE6|nr:monocarboxylate transporter 10-like [Haliotis rufescens]